MLLNYYNFSLLLGGIASLLSAVLIYSYNRQKENIVWFFVNLSMALWAFGYYLMINANTQTSAYVFSLILHVGGIFLALLFYYFSILITNTSKKYKLMSILAGVSAIVLLALSFTKYFVSGIDQRHVFPHFSVIGPLYIYYALYFFILITLAEYILFKAIINEKNTSRVLKFKYIFWATIIGYIGGVPTFFTAFEINIPPYSLILVPIYSVIITYAIIKHNLFDIRVISIEILLGILWIIIIFKISISQSSQDLITSIFLLLVTVVISLFSIRKTKNEVIQRERNEQLARELEIANAKMKELDDLKSEFISLATHHISSPLTAIKGYVSLLQEDEPAENEKKKETLALIQKLTNNTVNLVRDFIDVNQIDDGKVKYDFADFYLYEIIKQVVVEYEPQIKRKGIRFIFQNDINNEVIVHVDKDKFKRAVANILENSMKYSEGGDIKVHLYVQDSWGVMTITDNGIRNLPTISPRLLRKLTQSGNIEEANIIGNGIGIYAAKLLIEGNKGQLCIESPEQKTKFILKLPI